MAGRKHSASLVKMKQNPHGVPYPMSLRSLARYLAEWLATLSRSPVGAQPLRKSNKGKAESRGEHTPSYAILLSAQPTSVGCSFHTTAYTPPELLYHCRSSRSTFLRELPTLLTACFTRFLLLPVFLDSYRTS